MLNSQEINFEQKVQIPTICKDGKGHDWRNGHERDGATYIDPISLICKKCNFIYYL